MDFKFLALSPKPLEAEVQIGNTFLLSKVFPITKLSVGQAAIPHQIG